MAVEFQASKTRENLMRAFAGESQARNRYTFAADAAKKQGLYSIQQVFLFTADQERAHAERYYDLLKNLSGTTIEISGGYPVDHFDDVVKTRLRRWKRFTAGGLGNWRSCWSRTSILSVIQKGSGCA